MSNPAKSPPPPPPPNQFGTPYPNVYNAPYPPVPPPGYSMPSAPGVMPPSVDTNYVQPLPPTTGFITDPGRNPIVSGGWMNIPQHLINLPGLDILSILNQLVIHQNFEALTGYESNKKFTIRNNHGQKIYYAIEKCNWILKNICGSLRPFTMLIVDQYKNEILKFYRPLRCDSCFFPCCPERMEVYAAFGNLVGTIEQRWSMLRPIFEIKYSTGEVMLTLKGPLCITLCGDIEFKVFTADKNTQIGKIGTHWSGIIQDTFTDASFFGVTFPMDLDVRLKALLMGACFLINSIYYEKTRNDETEGPQMT